jgi:hypothetical protein
VTLVWLAVYALTLPIAVAAAPRLSVTEALLPLGADAAVSCRGTRCLVLPISVEGV